MSAGRWYFLVVCCLQVRPRPAPPCPRDFWGGALWGASCLLPPRRRRLPPALPAGCYLAAAGRCACHPGRPHLFNPPYPQPRPTPPSVLQFISIIVAVIFKFCGRQRDFESFEDGEKGSDGQASNAGNSSIQVRRAPRARPRGRLKCRVNRGAELRLAGWCASCPWEAADIIPTPASSMRRDLTLVPRATPRVNACPLCRLPPSLQLQKLQTSISGRQAHSFTTSPSTATYASSKLNKS